MSTGNVNTTHAETTSAMPATLAQKRFILASTSPSRLKILRDAGIEPQVMPSEVDEDAVVAALDNPSPEQVVGTLAVQKALSVAAQLGAVRTQDADSRYIESHCADPQDAEPLTTQPSAQQQTMHASAETVARSCADREPRETTQHNNTNTQHNSTGAEQHSELCLPAGTILVGADSMLLINGELQGKPHTEAETIARWHNQRGATAELLTGHAVCAGSTVLTEVTRTHITFAQVSDEDIAAYARTGEPFGCAGAFTLEALGGWFIERIEGDPSAVVGLSLPTVRHCVERHGYHISDFWCAD